MNLSMKKRIPGAVETALPLVTEAFQREGFGVLTRIDFHSKMKEKLGRELPPTVILGLCNPAMAFEAFARNPDVTALLPCNVVLRQVTPAELSVEVARPGALMGVLGDPQLAKLAQAADEKLLRALESI